MRGRIGRGRRVGSVVVVAALLVGGVVTVPLWLPAMALIDLVQGRTRLPRVRLGLFGLWWAALELIGITAATVLWAMGLAGNQALHYRLQRWWASAMWDGVALLTGAELEVEGLEDLRPGPVVVLSRHVSLADSVVTAVLLTSRARFRPRMVLKAELEIDPCLGVVGNRVPNVFLDRANAESTGGLASIAQLGTDLGPDDAVVIFPEGTRSNDDKRARSLAAIAERDPERADRLSGLQHLLPPRTTGTRALLDAAKGVDIVTIWHVGLDGLDSFSGILSGVADGHTRLRFVVRRWPRDEVPTGDDLKSWLDDRWLEMDAAVAASQPSVSAP